MKFNLLVFTLLTVLLPVNEASAHVDYKDLLQAEHQVTNPDGSKTYSDISATKSNGAWATAAGETGGENHSTPWYRIDITNPSGAHVDLTLSRADEVPGIDTIKDFTPAFSLYKGLVPPEAHLGVWYALKDTTLSNDEGEEGTINFLAHAGEVDSKLDSVSLIDYFLAPGSYTLALGGACHECYPHYERLDPSSPDYDPDYANRIIDIENDAEQMRGYELSLTIHQTPVPGAIWLMGTALVALFGVARRNNH